MSDDTDRTPSSQAAPPTMPGEAPPGMDPATRRGQSQARDMTGPGRWSDITTTSHREDTEPMNDITDPTHRIESKIEQQMRSDFMHAWGAYPDNPAEYDPAAGIGYAEYAEPWLSSDERWALDWDYLSDATLRWTEDPASAESQLALLQKCGLLSEVELRSEEQARYIAEHGIERDEAGQLTSHYVTRVQEREASGGASSALADYRPGSALSAHTTASERDGMER
ncbi:hypothetical protein IU474_06020 [Nocardia otitidiscaviarum]|uniref:hypothetical protein n=1 Tax=Nocardia otitidiscaviarum TaxID=1823 RepID=UPI001893A533|nr:hypothetical protein [Nocardia otitidiscaviarum]MBF6236634.1 hypothetical protein [Nocardia otitidiscaviarum]